jgi:KDO2-lipid IV(A) lauroyltransferase
MPLGTLVQFMLPRWAIMPLARSLGRLAFLLNHRQRRRIFENLRRTLGEQADAAALRRAAVSTFQNLAMNLADLLRVPVMRRRVTALVEFDDRNLRTVLAMNRGVVLVTPHLGNWDLAGVFLSALGIPISAVVEPVPRGWMKTYNRYRGALAMETIPIPDTGAIGNALERRRLLALVADRDLSGSGILLPAFGAQRSYPRGPATYALRYGCPVVVGYFVFQHRPGRPPYFAEVKPPLNFSPTGNYETDIPAFTRIIAEELNGLISRYPDQWLVFNPGWR